MKQILKKIAQLTVLAIEMNQKGPHHIWLNYSGHVQQFSCNISFGGWKEGISSTTLANFYIDPKRDDFDEINKNLDQLKDTLLQIKKSSKSGGVD